MSNPVIENIMTRRSVRKFLDKPVSDKDLQLIITAAKFAPSGHNRQSWSFLVFQSKEVLSRLNETVKQTALSIPEESEDYTRYKYIIDNSKNPEYCFFYNAPVLIVAANKKDNLNGQADCACALENMFLAAHSLGLGSCYINQLKSLYGYDPVRKFLEGCGLDHDSVVYGAAAIGYAENADIPAPMRKKVSVQYIK